MHRRITCRRALLGLSGPLLLLICLAGRAPLGAATFSVGSGVSCTHSTVPSAVAAAAASSGSDLIRIVDAPPFAGPAILTSESPVTFIGTTSCTSGTPQQRSVTINAGLAVFEFTSTVVEIRHLDISTGGTGRILDLNGGIVTLQASSLFNGWRRNVNMVGGASLVLQNGSSIHDGHETYEGAGVYCTGGGTLVVQSGSSIHHNTAGGRGGGVFLDGCNLNLQAGGPVSGSSPDARRQEAGAEDESAGEIELADGELRISGSEPLYYGISHNQAGGDGGGVYAQGGATIVASGGWFAWNKAQNSRGGGLFLTGNGTTADLVDSKMIRNFSYGESAGGGVFVENQAQFTMDRSAQPCAEGYRCSLLETNQSVLGLSSATGGTVQVESGGEVRIRQTMITDAAALEGGVAWVTGAGSKLYLEGVMLHDNTGAPLVVARSGALADLRYLSAAGNNLGTLADGLIEVGTNAQVQFLSSVVIESPGEYIFAFPVGSGSSLLYDCLLTHDTSITGGTNRNATVPGLIFAAPVVGDLRLRSGSMAIDSCDDFHAVPGDTDIEIEQREYNDPSTPNFYGFYDLGADEWRPLFVDGFNAGNTAAWSAVAP